MVQVTKPAMRVGAVVLGAVIGGAACAPTRVQLPEPPQKTASYEARRRAYRSVRPEVVETRNLIQLRTTRGLVSNIEELRLPRGVRVDHPADLGPWVEEDSATRRAITAYEARARRAQYYLWPATILGVGGLGTALGVSLAGTEAGSKLELGLAIGGLSAAALGAVIGWLGSDTREDRDEARQAAFRAFDGDLRARLGICRDSYADCAEEPAR